MHCAHSPGEAGGGRGAEGGNGGGLGGGLGGTVGGAEGGGVGGLGGLFTQHVYVVKSGLGIVNVFPDGHVSPSPSNVEQSGQSGQTPPVLTQVLPRDGQQPYPAAHVPLHE